MIKVFLADDHAIVRHGVRMLLEATPDVRLVGEVADGRALLTAAETADWDVLILDLSLPRVSGLEVLRRLRTLKPELRIIVLSMYPEKQFAMRVLREGASSYLSKERPGSELVHAIRRVASGGRYLTDTVSDQILDAGARAEKLPHDALSAREYQVFLLVIQGRTGSEIAAELDLTASTVSTHLGHIKDKLGAPTVADIVSYAHRAGLID